MEKYQQNLSNFQTKMGENGKKSTEKGERSKNGEISRMKIEQKKRFGKKINTKRAKLHIIKNWKIPKNWWEIKKPGEERRKNRQKLEENDKNKRNKNQKLRKI